MTARLHLFVSLVLLFMPVAAQAEGQALPRTLIALYDGKEAPVRQSYPHRFLEMPVNRLGFDMVYYDVNAPLPELTDDVYGVVIWLSAGNAVKDVIPYLEWLEKVVAAKKKLVIIENAGISGENRDKDSVMQRYNAILSYIGIQDRNLWNAVTYRTRILYMDNSIASFERPIGPILPPFGATYVIPGKAQSHLKLIPNNKPEDEAIDLIVTGQNGGFVTEGYAIFHVVEEEKSRIIQWFVNPFTFLQRALDLQLRPVPDITTINGKRIFYSHIDGDGWNNITEIPEYAKDKTIVAEVMRKEIMEKYSDLPFSVGVIINELDPNCYGVKESEDIARAIYAMPNVEPTSHTYSHPLYWGYFANYNPQKEVGVLNRYPERPKAKASIIEDIKSATSADPAWEKEIALYKQRVKAGEVTTSADVTGGDSHEDIASKTFNHKQYNTPRSYACSPFNMDQEIRGSLERVKKLSPPGKKPRLLQWSGDTSPDESALAAVREGGYININGGDSRFDSEYPSYTSVAPIGLRVGKERQIYSSNSNENTYTKLWTDRFFGFRYLQSTVENTETPLRVSPFNIYFHTYSAQKKASLHAVQENLNFARTQSIIPLHTSHYVDVANGFYSAKIFDLGNNSWKIKDRGALQTLRFDNAMLKSVDFNISQGVIGQEYFQGNLYVHLDPSIEEPTIKLMDIDKFGAPPKVNIPYLVEASWMINDLKYIKKMLTIDTSGFGPGTFSWMMPTLGKYTVIATTIGEKSEKILEQHFTTNDKGLLSFIIDSKEIPPILRVTVEPVTTQ